jgi:N-acetylmuramoyl-L-alanine amidase
MKRKNTQTSWFVVILIGIALVLFFLISKLNRPIQTEVQQQALLTPNTALYPRLTSKKPVQKVNNGQVTVQHYYLTKNNQAYAQVKLQGKHYYVRAKQLNLIQTNSVNQYLARLHYPHVKIQRSFAAKFARQRYNTTSGLPHGVVIHDTANGNSSLTDEVDYMERNYAATGVFVHAFIDNRQIVNIANTHYQAQGAGPRANPYYVQFEMPHMHLQAAFAQQQANASYYTAYILKSYGCLVSRGQPNGNGSVWTHELVTRYLGGTNHQDPNEYWSTAAREYFASNYNLNDFINLVQAYYNRMG